jgi:hypothetical protein
MIQSNELRVNNIFSDFHMNENDFFVMDESTIGSYAHNPESLRGVPLTEKWLFRLGFKKASYGDGDCNCYRLFSFNIHEIQDGYQMDYIDMFVCFKYVHELQNTYFDLTKEELCCGGMVDAG